LRRLRERHELRRLLRLLGGELLEIVGRDSQLFRRLIKPGALAVEPDETRVALVVGYANPAFLGPILPDARPYGPIGHHRKVADAIEQRCHLHHAALLLGEDGAARGSPAAIATGDTTNEHQPESAPLSRSRRPCQPFGHGTRLLPATKSQPKEMLAVARKPIVQYVAEELVANNIENVLFITGRSKTSIENHFDTDPELTRVLKEGKKDDLLAELKYEEMAAHIFYTRQRGILAT